jgi:hypothetical protein
MPPRHWTLAQRLDHRTDKSGGPDACWPWIGANIAARYGVIHWEGKRQLAHRLTWRETRGPIPPGLHILHKCDNPPCCNPSHLFLGTSADNHRDMVSKGRAWTAGLRGEAHGCAKLTEAKVREIRAAKGSQEAIAAQFGVCRATVSHIRNRRLWKHVP